MLLPKSSAGAYLPIRTWLLIELQDDVAHGLPVVMGCNAELSR
jgi:hypothetical protein